VDVPLLFVDPNTTDNCLEELVELQKILAQEERASYIASLSQKDNTHPFIKIHSSAVYQKALCRLLEYSCAPLVQVLQQQLIYNLLTLERLKKVKKELEQQQQKH